MHTRGPIRTLALQQPHEDALRWRGQLAVDRVEQPLLIRGQRLTQRRRKRSNDVFNQVQAIGGLCAPASRRLDAIGVGAVPCILLPRPLAIRGIRSGIAREIAVFGRRIVSFRACASLLCPSGRSGGGGRSGSGVHLARAQRNGLRVPQRQPGHTPSDSRARVHGRCACTTCRSARMAAATPDVSGGAEAIFASMRAHVQGVHRRERGLARALAQDDGFAPPARRRRAAPTAKAGHGPRAGSTSVCIALRA